MWIVTKNSCWKLQVQVFIFFICIFRTSFIFPPQPSWMFLCLFVSWVNATFNNISVISWQFYCAGPGENHRLVASHWQTLSHMLYISPWSRFELTSVVIGTDCIGSCKPNDHTITATTVPTYLIEWSISYCCFEGKLQSMWWKVMYDKYNLMVKHK